MRKLVIREEGDGEYHLKGFGRSLGGDDGLSQFCLVIESKSRHLQLEFPGICVFDLFTKIDLKQESYLNDRFTVSRFVQVKWEERETVVEAKSGSLYDLFKERGASGHCVLKSPLPLAFYWSGAEGDDGKVGSAA